MLSSQKKCQYWLNPRYSKSETGTSTIRDKMPLKRSKLRATRSRISERTPSGTFLSKISSTCRSILSYLPSVPTALKIPCDAREVVMEGVIPSKKESLVNFLQGMGLRPTVEIVGRDTVISADLSDIRNADLKAKFLNLMRRQAVSTKSEDGQSCPSCDSSSEEDTRKSSGLKEQFQREEKIQRESQNGSSDDLSQNYRNTVFTQPEQNQATIDTRLRNTQMGLHLSNGEIDFFKTKMPHSTMEDKPHNTINQGIPYWYRKNGNPENHLERRTLPTPPAPVMNGFRNLESNFLASNDYCSQLPSPGTRAVIEDEDNIIMSNSSSPERSPTVSRSLSSHELPVSLKTEWYNPTVPGPSVIGQVSIVKYEENKSYEDRTDSKKMKQFKHLLDLKKLSSSLKNAVKKKLPKNTKPKFRNCFKKKKNVKTSPSKNSFEVDDVVIPVEQRICFEPFTKEENEEEIDNIDEPKKPEEFDGGVPMPVPIQLNKSLFKVRPQEKEETSRSSSEADLGVEDERRMPNVSGNRADVHLAKNRIRLEGGDVRYGSILHKVRDFDERFKVLKENTFHDIESDVKKAKERITFARAVEAINDNSHTQHRIDLKELLLPAPISDKSRTKNELEVVATTSFYQKFLASMNIMKSKAKSDACDRSVMTDEPLSRIYAEFLSATATVNCKQLLNKRSETIPGDSPLDWDRVPMSDSVSDFMPNGPVGYVTKMCQCWEPLFMGFKGRH